jgi:hypothetical protein
MHIDMRLLGWLWITNSVKLKTTNIRITVLFQHSSGVTEENHVTSQSRCMTLEFILLSSDIKSEVLYSELICLIHHCSYDTYCRLFSKGMWQQLIHYTNIMLDIVHCLSYTCCTCYLAVHFTPTFGDCHYTDKE